MSNQQNAAENRSKIHYGSTLNVYSNSEKPIRVVESCEDARYYFTKDAGTKNFLLCIDVSVSQVPVVVPVLGDRPVVRSLTFVLENAQKNEVLAVPFFCSIPGKEGGKSSEVERYFIEKLKDGRVLVLFCSKSPVDMCMVAAWKQWLLTKVRVLELKVDFLREGNFDEEYIRGRIARHCLRWRVPDPQSRKVTLKKCGLVTHAEAFSRELSPVMFGEMQEVIFCADRVRQRFYRDFKKVFSYKLSSGIKDRNVDNEVETYQKDVREKLKGNGEAQKQTNLNCTCEFSSYLPKLLLRGETGVGKTFIADMMARRENQDGASKAIRISIPEFLGKEDYFEFMMFGYTPNSFTGASADGSLGLLLKNVGRVIYLDEIGEANAVLQAKLLAYLDDYIVRPRGWVEEKAFFAPTFIVAGTNRDLEKMAAEGTFRRDLLARFTDVLTIPPLRRRKESLDFILDCLLQREDINPEGSILGITAPAHQRLRNYSYEKGNFRELEDIMRAACTQAKTSGRTSLQSEEGETLQNQYIYSEDLTI